MCLIKGWIVILVKCNDQGFVCLPAFLHKLKSSVNKTLTGAVDSETARIKKRQ